MLTFDRPRFQAPVSPCGMCQGVDSTPLVREEVLKVTDLSNFVQAMLEQSPREVLVTAVDT